MSTYSDHEQRLLDQQTGAEMDRQAERAARRAGDTIANPPTPLASKEWTPEATLVILGGIVRHWNEFGAADGLQELMHYAHEYLEGRGPRHEAAQPESADKPCTCHPDDNPPVPCPRKYALSECRRTAETTAPLTEAERLLEAWANQLPPNGDLYWEHVKKARAYFENRSQAKTAVEPQPCEHLRSEMLAEKQVACEPLFQMRKCLDCRKIFRVRSSLKATCSGFDANGSEVP